MHKVLKTFPCSFDGVTIEELAPGDVREFGALAGGLRAIGYICDVENDIASPDGKKEANAASDKTDLSKLTNMQLRELAAAEQIAVESDDNKAGLIEKILAARAAVDG